MQRKPRTSGIQRANGWLWILLAAVLTLTACGRQHPGDSEAAGEIRGAPIVQKEATAPRASAPSNASAAVGTAVNPDYLAAGFDKLSGYSFEVSDELLGPITNEVAAALATVKTDAMIPKSVHELNNKRVALKGFMLPLKVEAGVVTELLIMKDQSMCCYGSAPKINEWVSVKMQGKGVKPLMDQPVTLFGTLRVGESRENGYLIGIYRLDGERMEVPEQ